MNRFEVHDRSRSPCVELVLAHPEVASASSLLASEVGQSVFDGDALTQLMPALGRRGELPQAMLQLLGNRCAKTRTSVESIPGASSRA